MYGAAALLLVIGVGLALLQTGWAKQQLRHPITRLANGRLTATLSIGRIDGSLFSAPRLRDVHLSRDGQTIVHIDEVAVDYQLRELFGTGLVIRSIKLINPHIVAGRQSDGRWDINTLLKPNPQPNQPGPRRALHFPAIEIVGGTVSLRDAVRVGIARPPTQYTNLNLQMAVDYEPSSWRLALARGSWVGTAPEMTVDELSGTIASEPSGLSFRDFRIRTPLSLLAVDGTLSRQTVPSTLGLTVRADRFSFQEWSGLVPQLSNVAVSGAFTAVLEGPPRRVKTTLALGSNGGDINGTFIIDTTSPGWRGTGEVQLRRLDLARWLNRSDDASDITGGLTFDINMPPGSRFPRGTYAFDGDHARFMAYEADGLIARGDITPTDVRIATATATAYGAHVRLDAGVIGIDAPFPFVFSGAAEGVDLRRVPSRVPVPHVESTLSFDYQVTGQFRRAFLKGTADFRESDFLGIGIEPGTTGSLDTSVRPFAYSGEGTLRHVDLHRLGQGLDVAWLQETRYRGTLDGRFHVDGAGGDLATLQLEGGGRLARADLFDGHLSDADVGIRIASGSLTGSYSGRLDRVNPARAMDDPRYEASLTGFARAEIAVTDLLLRAPELSDYDIDAEMTLEASEVRSIPVLRGEVKAALKDMALHVTRLQVEGPALAAEGSGTIGLDNNLDSLFDYDIVYADLERLQELIGRQISGQLTARGRLTGPLSDAHLAGAGTLNHFDAPGFKALTASLEYSAEIPPDGLRRGSVSLDGSLSFVEALGQPLDTVAGRASFSAGDVAANIRLVRADSREGTITATAGVDLDRRTIDVHALALTIGPTAWRLVPAADPPRLTWIDGGMTVQNLALTDAMSGLQRVSVDGSWYPQGGSALRISVRELSLDAFAAPADGPARYGGTVSLDVLLEGSRPRPIVSGRVSVVDGRVWRTPFEELAGSVDYADDELRLDLRVDQRPGVWLAAVGRLPADVLTAGARSERPMELAVRSSAVGLGLLEGATNVIRDVTGRAQLDVTVSGSPNDPRFDGTVDIAEAGFLVVASGARYRNGRMFVRLGSERVEFDTLHIEDQAGHALEVGGALATREFRVADLAVTVKAQQFEVLRNEFGSMDIDGDLSLFGKFESPRIEGRVTITRGELAVDAILDRTLFRPYSTVAQAAPSADAIAALNPWERIGIGIELHVPSTLRMVGDNIQVSPGTPLGLGAINLRALGDLYLYKDPSQPLYVTGSLDSISGTYTFQGRRFDLDPTSSINFRGDLNPDLYIMVSREISGVETHVTMAGLLSGLELRLTSTPPLDPSDILSLIVFNTSANELSATQQQQLAVRAGTIAAGFLAAPVLTAIERSLGLDTLEITPSADPSGGTLVTIGNEIAPGLVARFSRQFGAAEYDEAALEYYLSRIFRIRATFSDAASPGARSPFRRVERAGIDFLLFFSF
jgi:hypothetical protein